MPPSNLRGVSSWRTDELLAASNHEKDAMVESSRVTMSRTHGQRHPEEAESGREGRGVKQHDCDAASADAKVEYERPEVPYIPCTSREWRQGFRVLFGRVLE